MLERYLCARISMLASEISALGADPGAVDVVVVCGHWSLTVKARHTTTVAIRGEEEKLSACQSAVIQAAKELTGDWHTSHDLASHAGYPPNSYFRQQIAGLVRRHILERRGKLLRLTALDTPHTT